MFAKNQKAGKLDQQISMCYYENTLPRKEYIPMSDNELLLAISNIVEKQIEPLKQDIKSTKILLENDILPRLQNIEACYTSTYRRYADSINQIETMQSDISILKKVVAEHSDKLQKIS